MTRGRALPRGASAAALLAAVGVLAGCGAHEPPATSPRPSVRLGATESGRASWYGPDYHGRQTASGERYNMFALTAAHRTLPFGTLVRVENRENGREVIVRINDRGPFVHGRIVDLSYAAARAIGMSRAGEVKIRMEVVGLPPPREPVGAAAPGDQKIFVPSRSSMTWYASSPWPSRTPFGSYTCM